jgi:hypothetical protein
MSRRPSRARALLRELLVTKAVDRVILADALAVDVATLDAFSAGLEPIPLDAQARLATFVLETVPSLKRVGYQLRSQVAAAWDFQQGRTATHATSPPRY